MMTVVQLYDNGDEVPPGWPDDDLENQIDVDRVYGVNYDMTDEQARALAAIYRSLPGWFPGPEHPTWFGPTDSPTGWLSASFEPSGLQISGRLPIAVWQHWTSAFQAALDATDLPRIDDGHAT